MAAKYWFKPYKNPEEEKIYKEKFRKGRNEALSTRALKEGKESGSGRRRGFIGDVNLSPALDFFGNAGKNFSMDADRQFGFGRPSKVTTSRRHKPKYRWKRVRV